MGSSKPDIEEKWVASWIAALSVPLWVDDTTFAAPSAKRALSDGTAFNQTFRVFAKPGLWGQTFRVAFSNMFGDRDLHLSGAAVGLQECAAHVVSGTNTPLTFGGEPGVTIPKGQRRFSDPVKLSFVSPATKPLLVGRNLTISFAVAGNSGLLSVAHAGYSYVTDRDFGACHSTQGDALFPHATRLHFVVSELDVMAPSDTAVICAFGDSITHGSETVNESDTWPDFLARRARDVLGDKVSIVNAGIGGNTVVAKLEKDVFRYNRPAVERLEWDVLTISGLTSVIWLEGINDLGHGRLRPEVICDAYRCVIDRLHARSVAVIGATLPSSLWPEQNYDRIVASAPALLAELLPQYGGRQVDEYRRQINRFILNVASFDGVVDMAAATENPETGALCEEFQVGDYLHPNRAGRIAMAGAVDLQLLAARYRTASELSS